MVDGYESPGGENEPEDQNSRRTIQKVEEERPSDRVSSQPPATTTISTIAVQSGDTRLVIALLQSGEWLRLKVLEVQPGLTKLGASAEEATELLNAHDEVLLQLQSKQSPVEELLRQADQLISTQRPRAEVYAAMAETLGQAWRDVNAHLEHRKQILDSNVLFQCRTEEYRERMKALEMACNDTLLPIEIDAVKNFLTRIHDLRKNMLESLMTALQEGKTLLDKLKEVSNEGTLDSRPDQIKLEADHAILQVERWLEELHDKRRLIEVSFQSRKTQLEQCLALALLATDLRDLEEILNDRIAALASSSDQLGDSSASAELLLFELKKLQPEAKDFQDKSIKITKSTEQLVSSGHFAGEQATEQAYAILSAAADYLNDLDQYETLLNKAISFFRLAQSALTKLDQLEIQLITTEHPPHSAQLAQLHSQAVTMLEDVTAEPLVEGYALIDVTGRGAPGAEGVKRMVEELENRKIQLTNHCTAHKEESLRISQGLTTFLEKYNELYSWLVSIAEAFLQGHQDMGSVLPMAKDFYQLHYQLLSDLQKKGDEINETLKILPPIIEHIDDDQRRDVNNKVDLLHDDWLKLKNIIDARLDLSSLYVKFQEAVADLANEIDSIEYEFKKNSDTLNDEKIEELERKWLALQPLYLKLTASGKQFMDEARKITDPYLDISRACLCVETLMEHFANRQLTVSESWENWQTTITILKEKQIEQKRNVEESTKTLEWVSKFEEQLYPVITSESTKVSNILVDLESSQVSILPELKKAVTELNYRIKSVDALTQKGDDGVSEQIRRKLSEVYEHLQTTTSEYQIILESLISIFKNLEEVEKKTEDAKRLRQSPNLSKDVQGVRFMLKEHENTRQFVVETLKSIERETDRTITKIRQQEPPEAAQQDIDKLKRVIELEKSSWESSWSEKKNQLEEQLQLCVFDEDVNQINSNLTTLSKQLGTLKGQYKESLPAAKCASESFVKFEKTVTILEEKIETFIKTTTETISTIYTSAPQVRNELSNLKERWQDLKKQAEDTRKCVDLSIEYFKLLEEAEEWFREGSKLLVTIARKATTVKVPEDATNLLHDVDAYLKPGEEKQDERIRKIRELSTYVFGTDRLSQFNKVIVENREMLDSFTVISSELRTLVQNLKNAEDLRDTLRKEQEEADVKLNAARAEVMVAQAAAAEAENARKVAEILAAQTVEKATEEARRLGEVEAKKAMRAQIEKQKKILTSVSAQTEATDTEVVREIVTSAVTTKEIHILQKTEVEEAIPLPARPFTPKREASPPKKTKLEEAPPVPVPPQFTVPLSNATIQEGERLTFECQLTGFPEPEIVWYKDGISILNNPDYLTNYDHGICTLTIEETFAEDSAQFTCRAFNVAGSTETAATLKVKEIAPEEQLSPPIFSKELQASLATEGTTHQLECRVEGNPLPTVQWFKNESNIDNSPDYIITYNNGEAVLKFEEVFLEDQATYTCKATNQVGQASTFASLSVEPLEPSEKPYFVVPLSNIMARAGQKVKLECEARGIPCPNLSWTHNGKFIKESRDVKIQTEGAKSTLVISEAFPKDAGSYVVSARNLAGEAISSCNVSVKGRLPNETSDSELASDMEPVKPSIQLPLKNVQVFEGQTVRLDCVIIGQPEPEVIWYHDGQPVKESADFQLLFQGDRCSLIIHEAFLDDAGEYKVVAINSGGEASSKCILSVTLVEAEENLKSQVEKVPAGTTPKFIKLLTDVLVAEGEDTLFECMIIGEPKPELKWFLNNNEIVENERIKTTYGEDGTCILKISPTVPEDRGNYIAKATNNLGEAKAFAHLIVKSLSDFQRKEELIQMEEKHVPPMFKERFEERKVFEGSATKFECIVTGRPTPKIQWLFNDQPVCGKDFLISVSGDRQVLTIPETRSDQVGTVSCVAENIAGKATCTAKLKIDRGTNEELELIQVPPDEMQASSSSEKHFSKEKTSSEGGSESILTKMSSTITESSSVHTSTKKEYTSSSTTSSTIVPGQQPTSVCMKTTTHSTEQSSSENGAPPVVQSHKVEEYERIVQDKPGEIRQEKTVIVSKGEEGTKQESKLIQIQKPCRKSTAPKFVSPVTGMIVDQGADIVLEGIVDGYPQPTITWSKNGQELKQRNGVKISYAHNHVRVELKNVNVKDAGRYTCTAVNDVGTANSTADLVVKKTIFPPVFGRRLQAQVVKRGDRVIMEVEITGTPEPTVTWYKNDVPIKEQPPEVRIRQQGNCYLLVIEKVEKEHAGKYMVHAVNTGGEAQSIADFAVFEPTPDTMVEVHKTVVYENVKDKGIVQETVHTVTQSSQQQTLEKRLEPFPYKAADYPRPIPKKVPPPPSPSKFVKGEFRESDYESDYEGRIPPVWKPHGSDNEDYAFKPVKPNLVGTGKLRPTSTEPLPTPPTVFDNPPQYSGPPRPEFKPLDKVIKDTKQTEKKQLLTQKTKSISPQPKLEIVPTTPTKQKSVLLPGSPPEIGYAPPKQQTFYEGRSGAPFHNAIGTETKKTVRMDESTENTRRILTVEQTSRVIKFGENQNTQNKYSSYDKSSSQQQNRHSVPIPKKFVQGQFRESDYESDADIKIRPKWTPTDSDTEDLHYRKVQAPRSSRSSSVPTQRERVQTPMEFDTQPPVIPQQTIFTQHLQDVNVENRRLQRLEEMRKKFDSQTQVVKQQTSESNQKQEILKLGSPPEFGYVTKNDVKKAANYVASKHISDMTSSFKSKTEKFVKDIQSDLKQKPILKHPPDSQTADGDDTQAYREETRLAQYGTKHIDPDTGLIYFKYDFGYEFGIVLPGEGKKTVSSSSKTIQGQRRASDIDVPIIHEFTTKKANGFAKPSSQFKPSRFTNSKTVKWEPNSESEFSEAEDTRNRKRHSLPQTNFSAPSVVIPTTRWDQTTPSPVSLSPSLPSLSPHHSSVGPPSNVDSAGSPWPSNGVPTAKEVIQPYHDVLPKKAPLFITPLRDIAVVSGQTARFECIVQAEPQPNILWSKDGRIIENSSNYEIQYRNGVCRLTIPRAYPEDAGAYSCTATNGLGSTGTSATLQVPGNRRSVYSNK